MLTLKVLFYFAYCGLHCQGGCSILEQHNALAKTTTEARNGDVSIDACCLGLSADSVAQDKRMKIEFCSGKRLLLGNRETTTGFRDLAELQGLSFSQFFP
jgi:hypothetical protein